MTKPSPTPYGALLSELKEAEAYYSSASDPNLRQQSELCKRAAEELTRLRSDTERMDWLDCQGMIGISHESYGDYRYYAGNGFPPIREVIDKQMAKEKK